MKKFVVIILFQLIFFSCKEKSESTSTEIEITEDLKEFTLDQIQTNYNYICIENWNTGKHVGRRSDNYFYKEAQELNIPTYKLDLIESFYENKINPNYILKAKDLYKNNKQIELDYYSAIEPTAFCGMTTLKAGIVIYGNQNNVDKKNEAKIVAEKLIKDIPDWISGVKLNTTRYKDTILGITEDIDIGFLWRKGEKMQEMKSSRELYGYRNPEKNYHWHNVEWNNEKIVKH